MSKVFQEIGLFSDPQIAWEVADLAVRHVYPFYEPRELLTVWRTISARMFCLTDPEEVLPSAAAVVYESAAANQWELHTLVTPRFKRNNGYGSQLLGDIEGYAETLGITTLHLWTSGSAQIMQFYQNRGYLPTDEVRNDGEIAFFKGI